VVAIGKYEEIEAIEAAWGGADVTRAYPPVLVGVGQIRRTFLPVRGNWLLGVTYCGSEVLLLGHDGARQLLLLRGDGRRFRLAAAMRISELPRILNLDTSRPRPSPPAGDLAPGPAPRPPASTPETVQED